MNVQWTDQAAACPVVELHDIRTEKFRSDKYLSLVEDRLTGPFLAAGGHALGEFRVENHPDRLLLLRGYSSMPARRRALLKTLGGLPQVKRAGIDELAKVEGISRTLAERIYAHFH